MPFIPQEDRTRIDAGGEFKTVGDLCYVIYKQMVKQWNESPRWTTIHKIKKEYVLDSINSGDLEQLIVLLEDTDLEMEDAYTAASLAFDVFFYKFGMSYELKKIQENGDIDG